MSDNKPNSNIKRNSVTVSLACLVSAVVAIASSAYREGSESSKVEGMNQKMEQILIEVKNVKSDVSYVTGEVSSLSGNLNRIEAKVQSMDDDVGDFAIFIAEERARRELLKELQSNGKID